MYEYELSLDLERLMNSTKWKETKKENPDFYCKKCLSNNVEYRIILSFDEAYKDYEYHCKDCNTYWIVEGSDY